MNVLSYRVTDQNGLSFELLFDGQPFGDFRDAKDTPIPFWLFHDGTHDLPLYSSEQGGEVRIIAVCSCGEYGCGRTLCRVVHEDDAVIFYDFEGDLGAEKELKEFRISPDNYRAVISGIVRPASDVEGST